MRRVGRVAVIETDNPPVNALGQPVRQGLFENAKAAAGDDSVDAVVIACKGRTFHAGADITEFGKPPQPPALDDVLEILEGMDKPVVAAMHGTALGGGFEVALACHFRVIAPRGMVGLPEVKLGLLPGAGGTQRLPRLIGAVPALRIMVTGDPVPAKKALEMGAVDEIVEGDLVEGAVAFAERKAKEGAELRRLSRIEAPQTDMAAIDEEAAKLLRRTRGLPAPAAILETVKDAVRLPWAEGKKRERELFEELRQSPESAAQRHAFFAEREAQKVPGVTKDVKPREVKKMAVLGAGTMGGGITMSFASAGYPVTIIDQDPEALERGLGIIRKNYEATQRRGGMSEAQVEKARANITGSTNFDDVADADMVIEAVFENMALKKEIFGRLDQVCKPGCVLASNTSTLDVDEIAAQTSRPEDVVGMHFFSPANVMRLLEIVRGAKTAPDVLKTAMDHGKKAGKVPVVVGVCHGFVGNRMLHARARQVERLLLEGASPAEVDGALTKFGMAMGPCAMSDLAGLDVSWRVRQEAGTKAPVADAICEMGRFGQKTGKGYYLYEEGSRRPIPDPEIDALIDRVAKEHGIERRPIDEKEVFERLLFPMIDEAAKILDEGIALRASDIDIVYLYGYGFPVGKGGPMFYADQVGADYIAGQLDHYADLTGDDSLRPSAPLRRLAEAKGSFAELGKAA
ncbi:MAG: 3-hydroxyacyl-CoA dehydrogenase NAD-binding domain-containing protein [Pseudomonadota bacterium]